MFGYEYMYNNKLLMDKNNLTPNSSHIHASPDKYCCPKPKLVLFWLTVFFSVCFFNVSILGFNYRIHWVSHSPFPIWRTEYDKSGSFLFRKCQSCSKTYVRTFFFFPLCMQRFIVDINLTVTSFWHHSVHFLVFLLSLARG